MPDGSPHRREAPRYQEAWDWDLIVYPDGSLRVICMTNGCLWENRHPQCNCATKPRISSPVVDRLHRPLLETPYSGNGHTGDGLHLLTARAGSEIPVMSGKTYRLHGPRTPHSDFHGASVWEVYREPDPPPPFPKGLIQRVWEWLYL